MAVVHLKKKNICILIVLLILSLCVYRTTTFLSLRGLWDSIFGDDEEGPCVRSLHWLNTKDRRPLIGIYGPPGSGVVWLRYLIEQMTGMHTGSVNTEYPQQFVGEGKTKKVVAVMAHDVALTAHLRMHSAIVIYRNMQDTVRTHFAMEQGQGAFLEAPMQSYYGKDWQKFADKNAKRWGERYQEYIASHVPLLIISFDELDDPYQIQTQLLKISNFLHVPIRHSLLDCVTDRAADFPLKPKPLKHGFQPFGLLTRKKMKYFSKLENHTETLIIRTRERFRPKV